MTPCERLSDRMPAIAGGDQWTADEAEHLAGCADCAAEWAVVAGARALGADLAGGLNAHHVTERVLGRLRAERAEARVRRRGLALAALAAAAVVALAVWTGSPGSSRSSWTLDVEAADLSLAELDSLRAPELEALLHSMDRTSDDTGVDLAPSSPTDLEAGDLDGMLEALEG